MHSRPIRGVFAGTYTGSGHHRQHHHGFWEIIYQRTGAVETRQGPEVFHMRPGMILVHPPFVEHEDDSSSEYSLFYVQIDAPRDVPWPRVANDDAYQSIGKICEATSREWTSGHPLREDMIACLTGQLDLMLRRFKMGEHHSEREMIVAAAERILEERYNVHMTAAELASELGVSRSSLYSHFTAANGETPKGYVMRRRIEHALAMLQHTNYTLETIAEATGFYSPSHLARHVKAFSKQSPGTIRKLAKGRSIRDQGVG